MLSVLRRLCLVAVLWTTAQCGTVHDAVLETPQAPVQAPVREDLQPETSPDQSTDLTATLDLLMAVVDRAAKSAVKPFVAELNTRLNTFQTQLNSQNTGLMALTDQLSSVQTQLNSQNTELMVQLSNVQTQLNSQNIDLNAMTGQLSSVQTQLNSQNTALNTRLSSVTTQLSSQTDALGSRLDSVQTGLDSVGTELKSVQSDLGCRLDRTPSDLLTADRPVRDCSDMPAGTTSGIHMLHLGRDLSLVPAYCDLDTDGGNWTVIQRRADIQPRQDFFLGWQAYKAGFGELDVEFWWGLESMWRITSLTGRQYELRIDLKDFSNEERYALYQTFGVSSESDGYRMTVSGYSGNAGDSFTFHTGKRFSTKDKDQDGRSYSCAEKYKGGWWYAACHRANLNGLYLSGQTTRFSEGVTWYAWKGHEYSLKRVEMKIRPTATL